jgi:hypothetical protein
MRAIPDFKRGDSLRTHPEIREPLFYIQKPAVFEYKKVKFPNYRTDPKKQAVTADQGQYFHLIAPMEIMTILPQRIHHRGTEKEEKNKINHKEHQEHEEENNWERKKIRREKLSSLNLLISSLCSLCLCGETLKGIIQSIPPRLEEVTYAR